MDCPDCKAAMQPVGDVYKCKICKGIFIPKQSTGVYVSGSIIGIHEKKPTGTP